MRRDIRERGVLAWLAATMSAGLAGLLLRGPVSTALADWGAAAHICARLGWVCCLLAGVLLARGAGVGAGGPYGVWRRDGGKIPGSA